MEEPLPFKIFVIEDDPTYRKFLEYVLSLNPDFEVSTFENGKSFIESLDKNPSLVTLDYSLPDIKGEDVLSYIKKYNPDIPVIVISAQEKIGTAVSLLKLGAFDYIVKDDETKDKLLNTINNARRNISLITEIVSLRREISEKYEFSKSIIGNSKAIKDVFKLLEKAVSTNITVSITGETGTGKELVAKAIHYNSARKNKKFVAVNIAAIPKELIESELFGHEKGAFTGAASRRLGRFEDANRGTIFLDEIGEMDINLQAKLLRVLQEKEISRIGGNEVIKLDVRVIVATHKDLPEEVSKGNFREDLFYRLLGLPVHLPPLRERDNDIILIAKSLLRNFCKENRIPEIQISVAAQEKLMQYSFPGNVRELKSIIELAAVMCNGESINSDDLKFGNLARLEKLLTEELTLRELNIKVIKYYLEKYDSNVKLVADKLGIGKSSIYRYLNNEQ
ncbi:MAG TPA: sigma-54 dependent transcriptional regulator [Cyclobacteriaceae bacterium]